MAKKEKFNQGFAQNLVVIELSGEQRRIPSKPHLYVTRTQRTPEAVLQSLQEGKGPKWIQGRAKTLRPDLIPRYKPTRKKEIAEVRLKNLKIDLARKGYAINGDTKTWRIYVLDIDADLAPPIKNRGKLNKVVYVGQTSSPIEVRVKQHQGKLSQSGRYIGSSKVKGRQPELNLDLTPSRVLYTKTDAVLFETSIHKKLKQKGYRVLGDVVKSSKNTPTV